MNPDVLASSPLLEAAKPGHTSEQTQAARRSPLLGRLAQTPLECILKPGSFFPWIAPHTFADLRPSSPELQPRVPSSEVWAKGIASTRRSPLVRGFIGAWEPSGLLLKPTKPFTNYILKSIKIG